MLVGQIDFAFLILQILSALVSRCLGTDCQVMRQLKLCKLPELSGGMRAGPGCAAQDTELWPPDVSRCGVHVPASPGAGQWHIPPCWDVKVWQEPPFWGRSKRLHKICSDLASLRAWEIIAMAECAYFAFSINILVCLVFFFLHRGICFKGKSVKSTEPVLIMTA